MQTELISMQQSFILKSTVPTHILDPMNQYLDQLLEGAKSISHADKLVGRIKGGKQLTISPQEKRVKLFINTIQEMSLSYYQHFHKINGTSNPLGKIVDVQDIWSVHCYAGDYNPLHNHLCNTLQGLSGILYTKVPPTIQENTTLDGCLEFVFGRTPATGSLTFMFSQSSIRRPAVGDIYLFPNWLEHMVYPFDGEGERRSVAFNVNFWDIETST